ncbi:methyl-accepting chemotaxis protein [Piscirickettsia litoralis]|uniref:Chemotaxis protein n=1 Tax=Piscirickettsia litoralis TaxID=1891921 RepID=A0ABX2ZZS1_9GAMM|nr:methyl-accepting chemotaxis protein [Piscirickettsia litoralis]ODN41733.1 hypothetical protein BGC07_00455 [Piscirickettsia litoralis]
MAKSTKEYQGHTNRVVNIISPEVEKNLSSVAEIASTNENFKAANQTIYTLSKFESSRVYLGQYLTTNKKSEFERFNHGIVKTKSGIANLQQVVTDEKSKAIVSSIGKSIAELSTLGQAIQKSISTINESSKSLTGLSAKMIKDTTKLQDNVWQGLNARGEHIESAISLTNTLTWIITAVAVSLGLIVSFLITRKIGNAISHIVSLSGRIAEGHMNDNIEVKTQDELGNLLKSFKTMQSNLKNKMAEEKEKYLEGLRIKVALDSVNQNVMLADKDYNIIYLNDSLKQMLSDNEEQIQKQVKAFDAQNIIGTNIDTFHKNPAHQRKMLDELTEPYSTTLVIGDLHLAIAATPIFDEDNQRTGTVTEWEDVTESILQKQKEEQQAQEMKAQSEENGRIKVALDRVNQNVMMADKDLNIIYINDSLQTMLSDNEEQIKKYVGKFDANNLIGQCIDIFHKNPAHQRKILDELTAPYEAKLQLGDIYIDLTASPIFDEHGERIGTVTEWNNVSEERRIEKEVNDIIHSVSEGNLNSKVETEGKDGFYLNLAEGLNKITDINRRVLDETTTVMQSLSQGNLNTRMEGDYQGSFAELKQYINNTVGHLTNAIGDTVSVLGAVSKGDLTRRIHGSYDGIFNDLQSYVNQTSERLTDIIEQIRSGSQNVSKAAGEVATGNNSLNQRTQEQATALEETSASMEEISSMVTQTSKQSDQANELSKQAKKCAENGGQVVTTAINAMETIESSSKEISAIINVIDDIAFQTNLLALNAAVEAARAGEQGRGFAVVASEVRNLAQRSASSAKEIKELINASVNKIEDGAKLVIETGKSLDEIVQVIQDVSKNVGEINNASQEQAAGVKEVNRAVIDMDQKTQANNSLVKQMTQLGEDMDQQANQLLSSISFFHTDTNTEVEDNSQHQNSRHEVTTDKAHTQLNEESSNNQQKDAVEPNQDQAKWENF